MPMTGPQKRSPRLRFNDEPLMGPLYAATCVQLALTKPAGRARLMARHTCEPLHE